MRPYHLIDLPILSDDLQAEDIMTVAENLIQKGRLEGENKTKVELAVNFYKLGNSVETIVKARCYCKS